MVVAGLAVGLVIAEWMFRIRDDGGFPKLNVYVADRGLGVRLQPGASQRFVYPDNPPTRVRINRAGYRGADFPKPGTDDVLIVGDSQVFGLGVEEHQTFAALLQRELGGGRAVLNGGVPTYGPAEYAAVARELLAARHPRTLVFTVNLVNDLFEVNRPNAERHVVRDGWAVRTEAAGRVIDFPGRTWLARNSHLFYAVRQVWHRASDGQSVASEGTWHDLVDTGTRSAEQRADTERQQQSRSTELRQTEAQLEEHTEAIDRAIMAYLRDELTQEDKIALEASHHDPGDTVQAFVENAEESRSVVVTASHIRRGAILRTKLRDKLAKLAQKHARGEERTKILGSLADQPKLAARLDELGLERIRLALESPLAPTIRELKRVCDEQAVRLVVLILPIDVAVSPEEWKKYGAQPIDMTSVGSLIDELRALGDELGVSTLDATAALRAVQPGAFLDHDIHMTPRGHAAVATALAATLASPPSPPRRGRDRSPLPLPAQWRAAPEILVAGSSAAHCETKRIREWLRILCIADQPYDLDASPKSITITRDQSHGALTMVMPRSAALTVALEPGDALTADFAWQGVQRRLDVTWPAEQAAPTAAFTVTSKQAKSEPRYGRVEFPTELARAMCGCWQAVYLDRRGGDESPDCPGIYGALDAGCLAYRGACPDMVACALRDPATPPRPTTTPPAPVTPP